MCLWNISKVSIAVLSWTLDGKIEKATFLIGLMFKYISQRAVKIQHITVKSRTTEHDGEDKTSGSGTKM